MDRLFSREWFLHMDLNAGERGWIEKWVTGVEACLYEYPHIADCGLRITMVRLWENALELVWPDGSDTNFILVGVLSHYRSIVYWMIITGRTFVSSFQGENSDLLSSPMVSWWRLMVPWSTDGRFWFGVLWFQVDIDQFLEIYRV